jgi:hypothetical protein
MSDCLEVDLDPAVLAFTTLLRDLVGTLDHVPTLRVAEAPRPPLLPVEVLVLPLATAKLILFAHKLPSSFLNAEPSSAFGATRTIPDYSVQSDADGCYDADGDHEFGLGPGFLDRLGYLVI